MGNVNDHIDTWALFLWLAVAFFILLIGMVFNRTSASTLLEWDQRAGKRIYERELRSSNDHEKALMKAQQWYTLFSMGMITMATIHIVVVTAMIARRFWFG